MRPCSGCPGSSTIPVSGSTPPRKPIGAEDTRAGPSARPALIVRAWNVSVSLIVLSHKLKYAVTSALASALSSAG